MYSGSYINSDQELQFEDENSLMQDASNILAASGLTAGALAGVDVTRRMRNDPTKPNAAQALQALGQDIRNAAGVLTDKTPYDAMEAAATIGEGSGKYRSMQDFARRSGDERYSIDYKKGDFVSNPLTQAAIAARDGFNASPEDFLSLKREFRQEQGQSAEGPRTDTTAARIPSLDAARDLLGNLPGGFSQEEQEFRARNNINVMQANNAQKFGSFVGRAGSDFVNNGVRSLWWLINAPQAIVDLAAEAGAGATNREGLYGQDLVGYDEAFSRNWVSTDGRPLTNAINRATSDSTDPLYNKRYKAIQDAVTAEPNDPDYNLRRGVYSRRRTNNNLSTLMALPAAIGINAGVGLLSGDGRTDGRAAIFKSEEDPTVTANVIGEVAAKYFLGRQGDLLPWDEFKKVRPDVSRDEYMKYKAYRWDKNVDLNPFDDGKVIAPLGLLKYNNDGINGPEVQFLGKDMALDTAILPTAAAALATAAGAGLGRYGSFNEIGIEEKLERGESQIQKLRQSRDGTAEQRQKRIKRIQDKATKLNKRKEFLQNIPGGFSNRMRNKNPVVAGLALGTAGLLGGTAIGNMISDQRRNQGIIDNGGL